MGRVLNVDGDKLVVEDTTTERKLQNVNADLIDPYMYGFSANVLLTHTERRYGSGKRLREENVKLLVIDLTYRHTLHFV